MTSEMPPFSSEQDEGEPELPQLETILVLLQAEIQALKQVEIASTQFLWVLERQVMAGEILRTQMKKHHNIPRTMKKAHGKQQYWWDSLAVEIKGYGDQCESYRTWLEGIQETCGEKMLAFKQLQEDVDNLYPQ